MDEVRELLFRSTLDSVADEHDGDPIVDASRQDLSPSLSRFLPSAETVAAARGGVRKRKPGTPTTFDTKLRALEAEMTEQGIGFNTQSD